MATEEVAMPYRLGAVERAMKVQEVIVRAIAGQLTRCSPATFDGSAAIAISWRSATRYSAQPAD
jgi:hypothetical protein